MTRLSTHEQIVVMQAFVDGKEIEYKGIAEVWYIATAPTWDWLHKDFRIKAEPKEVWLVYTELGRFIASFSERVNAENYVNRDILRINYTIHKMVEDTSCDT